MTTIIEVVTPAFFAILVGYLVGKLMKINMAPVVDLTLYIGVPILVFVSLMEKEIVWLEAAKICTASTIVQLGSVLAGVIVFKCLRQKHGGMYAAIGLMNAVNIPFPIIFLAYGAAGLVPATLYYIPNLILLYTLGVFLMAGDRKKESLKEIVRQPAIWAAVLGLALNALKVPVPYLATSSLKFVSQMVIPLVLIILGYNLAKVRATSLPTTLIASVLRIGVGLGLGLLMAGLFGLAGVDRTVVILVSAMPSAALTSILASKYNSEPELVSSIVFVTTLASLVVIPVLLHFFG